MDKINWCDLKSKVPWKLGEEDKVYALLYTFMYVMVETISPNVTKRSNKGELNINYTSKLHIA